MGKFEKLVVLTVVFTAAIVLAISFNRGGGEVEASGPLTGADELLGKDGIEQAGLEDPSKSPARQSLFGRQDPAPTMLLDAGGSDAIPPFENPPADDLVAGLHAGQGSGSLIVDPSVDLDHRILRDTNGLRPSFLDEYRMYTVAEGDTWSGLAQRFYQDGRFTRNLHIANEDLEDLQPGKEILVPVFDLLADLAPQEPSAMSAESPAGAPLAKSAPSSTLPAAKPAAKAPADGQLLEYVVRSGDTLSEISNAVFGTSTRWKEILEANRDKLQKPESLQAGMKLKIPQGGKLPAAQPAKASDKQAEPKSKPSQTAEATTPKKKKVL